MKIKKELALRQVAGDSFLVPIGTTVYDHNGIFVLTELGAFIWTILPDADSADDILQAVLEEYDVDKDTAFKDIESFLEKLRKMDII